MTKHFFSRMKPVSFDVMYFAEEKFTCALRGLKLDSVLCSRTKCSKTLRNNAWLVSKLFMHAGLDTVIICILHTNYQRTDARALKSSYRNTKVKANATRRFLDDIQWPASVQTPGILNRLSLSLKNLKNIWKIWSMKYSKRNQMTH